MGTPKGHEKRGDERPEAGRDSALPQASRGKRGRGRPRRRGRGHATASGEGALPASEGALYASDAVDTDRSGERNVAAVGFVELSDAAPMAVDGATANSNHRADITLPRAPAEQEGVLEPDAVGRRSRADDEAYRRRREADDTTASVLDAPYSMHPSAPPVARPSWALRLWVALMCCIIGAAGLVALKNRKADGASPQAPTSEASAGVEAGGASSQAPEGTSSQAPELVRIEAAPAAATVLRPVEGESAPEGQVGEAHGSSEPSSEPEVEQRTQAEEAEAKPTRSRGRTPAPEQATSSEDEPASVTRAPAVPSERTPRAALTTTPEARLGGLPPGPAAGGLSGRAEPSAAEDSQGLLARPASAEAANQAESERGRRGHVESASLPQLPQNPYDTDAP